MAILLCYQHYVEQLQGMREVIVRGCMGLAPRCFHIMHTPPARVQDIGCSKRTASASPSGPVLLCCDSQAVCWPSSCCRILHVAQLTERSDIAWILADVGRRMGANKQCVCQWHVRNTVMCAVTRSIGSHMALSAVLGLALVFAQRLT